MTGAIDRPRTVVWFSCGAASAVAARLTSRERPDAVLAYCETGAEHSDNERFLRDCERWMNTSVVRLKSTKFADTWDVWTRERYLAGIKGAPCTRALKFRPRLEWQHPDDIHVFGYTADGSDKRRADTLRANYPELRVETPLIDAGLTKAACLAMLQNAGIELPTMYALGFHNNNCIPCVKAQSPSYWALVREKFPAEFERMSKLSRELNVRLCKIKGERRFIDEIPADQSTINPIAPSCDFLCEAMIDQMETAE